MNELLIPPSPNWYESYMLACTPDNTLIYGTRSDIVIIKDTPEGTAADIKIIQKAHSQRITSVFINRNYGQPNKLIVSLGEEKVVKVWDVNTLEKKASHSAHVAHERVVGAVFAGDDRVISVSENGVVVIWNVLTNQTSVLSDMFNFKLNVTSLSSCPHATWLAAFGLKNGLVVIADLRKKGKVLYKLRGHEKPVVSLVWCPVPVNIFPKNPNNFVGTKKSIKHDEETNSRSSKESVPQKTLIEVTQPAAVSSQNSTEAGDKLNLLEPNHEKETDQTFILSDARLQEEGIEEEQVNDIREEVKDKTHTEDTCQQQDNLNDVEQSDSAKPIVECINIAKNEQIDESTLNQIKIGKQKVDQTDQTFNLSYARAEQESIEEKHINDIREEIKDETQTEDTGTCQQQDNLNNVEQSDSAKPIVECINIARTEQVDKSTLNQIKIGKQKADQTDQTFNLSDARSDQESIEEKQINDIREELKDETHTEDTGTCQQQDKLNNVEQSDSAKLIVECISIARNEQIDKSTLNQIKIGKQKGDLWKDLIFPDDIESQQSQNLKSVSDFLKDCASLKKETEQVDKNTLDKLKTGKKIGDLWRDLEFPDDIESQHPDKQDPNNLKLEGDFLKDCELLKKEILSVVIEKHEMIPATPEACSRPKLTPRRSKGTKLQNEPCKISDGVDQTENREVVTEGEKGSFFFKENMMKIEASTPMIQHEEDSDSDSGVNLNKSMLESNNGDFKNDDTEVEVKVPMEQTKEEQYKKEETTYSRDMELTELKECAIEDNKKKTIIGEVDMSLTCDVGRSICVSEEEEPRKEFLLASSAREGNIYIWRAGTDGRLQTLLTTSTKSSRRNRKHAPPEKVWIALCWPTPSVLLSSSKNAELLEWTLPKPKESKKEVRIIHNDHNSLLFNIASPIKYLTEEHWNQERGRLNAWTIGKDRVLLNTDLGKETKVLSRYPTLGGCVTTFATSPVDPNRLAFGTSECNINIFDLSKPHTKCVVTTTIHQKVQSKVTALAWHPTQELLLAYGTAEGRVGYVDVSSKSKLPILFTQFFKSEIHKLEWGPLDGDTSDLVVYAASESKLVTFSLKKSGQGAAEFDLPDNTQVYTFTWKPDFSLLLISTQAGTLLKYDKNLSLLSTAYLQQRLQHVAWHPDASISDTNVSKYCNWLAALNRNVGFCVYEIQAYAESIVFKLDDKRLMTAVAWSPHDGNRLVVGFDEGFANVYDVETQSVLYTYINPHFDNILSLIWSPADPDLIITGLVGNKLQIWNVTKYQALSNEEINSKRKKVLKLVTKEPKGPADLLHNLNVTEDNEESKVNAKCVSKSQNILLPLFYSVRHSSQTVKDTRKLIDWKKGDQNVEANVGDNKYIDLLQVFGHNKEMVNILNKNETSLKDKGKYNLSTKAALFKGDLLSSVKEAIAQKRVDPFIISLCPMISPKLWQSACETYAQQLLEQSESDPLEVATYFLAVHKVEEAINALCENLMFKEAFVLAKSRLQDGDSVINTIIEKWAKHLQLTGNFEMAANCFVCLEKYEEAAMVLFRRADVEVLKLAADLAEMSGNEELIKAVTFRYNAFKETETNVNKDTTHEKEDIKSDTEHQGAIRIRLDLEKTIEAKDITSRDEIQKNQECEESEEKLSEGYQDVLARQESEKDTKETKEIDLNGTQKEKTVIEHEILTQKSQDSGQDKVVLHQESLFEECIENGCHSKDVTQKQSSESGPSQETNGVLKKETEYKYLKEPNVLHEFLEKYYKPKKDENEDIKTNEIGCDLQEPRSKVFTHADLEVTGNNKKDCDFEEKDSIKSNEKVEDLGIAIDKVDSIKTSSKLEEQSTDNDGDNISLD